MKKKAIIALVVAALMAIQVPMVAMASTPYPIKDDCTVDGDIDSGAQGAIDLDGTAGHQKVTVNGSVTNSSEDESILGKGATTIVHVTKDVTNSGKGSCVNLEDNAEAIVDGKIIQKGSDAEAALYVNNAKATVGSIEAVDCAVSVGGDSSNVKVNGDVKSTGDELAVGVSGGTVEIKGNISNVGRAGVAGEEDHDAVSIAGGTLKVIGNITSEKSDAAWVNSNSTLIVTGDLSAGEVGIYGETGAEKAKVLVKGNIVKSETGIDLSNSNEKSTYEVDGNIVASICGINGGGNDIVIVTGTISGNDNPIEFSKTEQVYVGKFELANGDIANYDPNGNITDLNYIIKNASSVGSFTLSSASGKAGTVTGLDGTVYQTAKESSADTSDIKIEVAVVDGYTFKSFGGDSAAFVKDNGDGTYTLIVPRGGGVSLDLVYEAVQKAQSSGGGVWSVSPSKMGSAEAPVTNGAWTNVNGAFRYTVNGDTVKNAIATIQYKAADGNTYTGSFYFDRNGTMQTGWQQIDGVWYYFNAAQGPTQGMMLTNTTTPDGYQVGANGAWIH